VPFPTTSSFVTKNRKFQGKRPKTVQVRSSKIFRILQLYLYHTGDLAVNKKLLFLPKFCKTRQQICADATLPVQTSDSDTLCYQTGPSSPISSVAHVKLLRSATERTKRNASFYKISQIISKFGILAQKCTANIVAGLSA